MEAILECCCGLDVHKDKIEACILTDAKGGACRETFGSISTELDRLCQWLNEHKCRHIAMESTGVYWQAIYERIEDRCPEREQLLVVNARHMRNLPGRKTDVKDAEWIAQLLQHGLLSNSFIPDRDVRGMRELSRIRRSTIRERATQVNRLEKFLQRHGFKLSSVVSDIVGASGMRLLRTLAKEGTLSLGVVRYCCNAHLKHTSEEIYAAITGKLETVERECLSMMLDWLDQLDKRIEKIGLLLLSTFGPYAAQVSIATSLPGISQDSAMEILAEISPSPMKAFSNGPRLCSWAGLVPRNDESAGAIKSRRILPGNPYVKTILVQCAWAAVKTRNSEFNRWFWSRQGRIGRKKAIIAVARKLLLRLYTLLARGEFYSPPAVAE